MDGVNELVSNGMATVFSPEMKVFVNTITSVPFLTAAGLLTTALLGNEVRSMLSDITHGLKLDKFTE